MHIPDSMLNGAICPISAILSTAGILSATWFTRKAKEKPSALQFASVTSFIFGAQMLNFPILAGTSGHLLGGVLAAAALGIPFGILAIALVVALQSLLFSDGGLLVLGSNIFNMALLGAGLGGVLYQRLTYAKSKFIPKHIALALASWISVVVASFAVSLELALSGVQNISTILPTMVGIHAIIGIFEAAITVACFYLYQELKSQNTQQLPNLFALFGATLAVVCLAPFASNLPDGLEWIAIKYQFFHESAPSFVGPFATYMQKVPEEFAGLLGLVITFSLAFAFVKIWSRIALRKSNLERC